MTGKLRSLSPRDIVMTSIITHRLIIWATSSELFLFDKLSKLNKKLSSIVEKNTIDKKNYVIYHDKIFSS